MITIRAEQAAALEQDQRLRFEAFMLDHIRKFFPEEYERDGEAGMRTLVKQGEVNAGVHGFTSERDVCKYVDLMIAYGPAFDQLPWAEAVLKAPEPKDAGLRMHVLCERGLEVEEAGGEMAPDESTTEPG